MSRWLPRLRRARRVWGVDARDLAWHPQQRADAVQSAQHGAAAGLALAAAQGGRDVHAIAANELAVHWLQPPPGAARSLEEIRLVAAARCAHLFGGAASDWWVAGDWSARRAFVCAAVPVAVSEPLRRAAAQQGLRLHWHSAWGVLCGARARSFPDQGWSGMRTPARVLLWHCSAGQVDAMTTIAVTPQMDAGEVARLVDLQVQLEKLGSGTAAPPAVHWADDGGADSEAVAALRLAPLLEAGP